MPKRSSPAALLVIDVINDLEFPGGEKVLPWANRMVTRLAPLCAAARRAGVPVIYANDNFGHWHSSFEEVYRHCTRGGARGAEIARKLKPRREDYFVLKPKHSAFFASSLQPLLQYLGVRRVVLAGIATNLCVLFTAHDAHMREYEIIVASDCCAAESDHDHNIALQQLERFCDATICRADQINVRQMKPKSSR